MSLPPEFNGRKAAQEKDKLRNMQEQVNELGENASEPASLVRHSIDLSTRTKRFQSDVRNDSSFQDNRSSRWSVYSGDFGSLYQDPARWMLSP